MDEVFLVLDLIIRPEKVNLVNKMTSESFLEASKNISLSPKVINFEIEGYSFKLWSCSTIEKVFQEWKSKTGKKDSYIVFWNIRTNKPVMMKTFQNRIDTEIKNGDVLKVYYP